MVESASYVVSGWRVRCHVQTGNPAARVNMGRTRFTGLEAILRIVIKPVKRTREEAEWGAGRRGEKAQALGVTVKRRVPMRVTSLASYPTKMSMRYCPGIQSACDGGKNLRYPLSSSTAR